MLLVKLMFFLQTINVSNGLFMKMLKDNKNVMVNQISRQFK